jgi:hypothetical protein
LTLSELPKVYLLPSQYRAVPLLEFTPVNYSEAMKPTREPSEYVIEIFDPPFILHLFRVYDKTSRTYLFNLDFAHLRQLEPPPDSPVNGMLASKKSRSKLRGSTDDGAFKVIYTMDAYHVGNVREFYIMSHVSSNWLLLD